MTLAEVAAQAAAHGLAVFGAFHPVPEDDAPEGVQTLVLLGPAEPGFWVHLTAQPEWADGKPDPVDRWSRRVIGRLACDLRAKALFPFGGPPWHPFFRWALRSGRAWQSPVRLLVHDTAGLMVSYRGALALRDRLVLPPPPAPPCESCAAKPCLTACPAGALTPAGYDVPACHAFLDTPPGEDCRAAGCRVRRACPVSQSYGRMAVQSAYHMRQFHP
ncbi:ferredoxin [Ruixingdingia sedimenti]|uniref:Ferredoxin n=1 Tax=Ruixingdingia sedimenti TaxID=3073604 RepID=A0ABU1FD51_9RHOB|nr:ferredoxin [Xinfangfangia sp. LG-4]MDR5654772.1 ferredoxin [Xinfangfangia sp. LG-4]